jgi:ABC-2 type transport system ATP-binding protein
LGPNGSGKSTLFHLLSTLCQPASGSLKLMGHETTGDPFQVRSSLGVVFQRPGLDAKLKVRENLKHQGMIYGLSGSALNQRIDDLLEQFQLSDRANDPVETLSGGLARRTELAKALLHGPKLLILDEPSTGLDPAACLDFWAILSQLQTDEEITILVTTHLMEEAERCHRIALLNEGELVALDTPHALKSQIGGQVITLHNPRSDSIHKTLNELGIDGIIEAPQQIKFEHENPGELLPMLMERVSNQVAEISVGQPSLHDVFLKKTGRDFRNAS